MTTRTRTTTRATTMTRAGDPAEPHLRLRSHPVARTRGALHILDVRDDLSRISRANGEIVGYVDRIDIAGGPAYRARRYVVAERRFVPLPTVWNADDAVDMLRF
jgi:hypothetical protein